MADLPPLQALTPTPRDGSSASFDYSALAKQAKATESARRTVVDEDTDRQALRRLIQLGVKSSAPAGVGRDTFYRSITHLHLDNQGIKDISCVWVRS